jgi:hypothetical protein
MFKLISIILLGALAVLVLAIHGYGIWYFYPGDLVSTRLSSMTMADSLWCIGWFFGVVAWPIIALTIISRLLDMWDNWEITHE